jgi:hypothetical protein
MQHGSGPRRRCDEFGRGSGGRVGACLTACGARDYALEYVGRLALAKNYGESRIYRLERR